VCANVVWSDLGISKHSEDQQGSKSDKAVAIDRLQFEKVIAAELVKVKALNDEDVASSLWADKFYTFFPLGDAREERSIRKLLADKAAANDSSCATALQEIEELFPAKWQLPREVRNPWYRRQPLGIKAAEIHGNLTVSNTGDVTESFILDSRIEGSLDLVGTKSKTEVSLSYVVVVDQSAPQRLTVRGRDEIAIPLRIYIEKKKTRNNLG
jgi:hypothetical protein